MIPSIEVKETGYRWVILFLYSFCVGCNAMLWITAAPITSVISKTYGVADIWVEMCSLVYMILYLPIVFPSNYILDTFGLRVGILIGAFCTVVGAWIRVGAASNFWFILIGSCFGAIGQPFLLNSPGKVAATWFRPDMRTMATTVGTMSNPLGVAIGFLLPAFIVTANKSSSQIVLLMLVEAIICTVMFVLILFLFTKAPKHPPSISASQKREEFWPALKKVFKNKSFLCLLVAFSFGQGAVNALATLIDLISRPYNFSTFDNSVFGGLLIICGLVGAGIVGTIVTITHKYKCTSILISIGALSTFVIFIFTLPYETLWISCISVSLLGLFLTPILPISYEFGIELTYPIGEAMTGGILNSGGQLVGISEVGLAYLMENQPMIICLIAAGGIGIGIIAFLLAKEDLQRAGVDDNKIASMVSLKEAE